MILVLTHIWLFRCNYNDHMEYCWSTVVLPTALTYWIGMDLPLELMMSTVLFAKTRSFRRKILPNTQSSVSERCHQKWISGEGKWCSVLTHSFFVMLLPIHLWESVEEKAHKNWIKSEKITSCYWCLWLWVFFSTERRTTIKTPSHLVHILSPCRLCSGVLNVSLTARASVTSPQ